MSRETRVSYQCDWCGCNGIGFRNDESYDRIIPNGWTSWGSGYYLCATCSRNPDARLRMKKNVVGIKKIDKTDLIGKICAFSSIMLSFAGVIASSINVFIGIVMFALAILPAIYFFKCEKWRDDTLGNIFAVVAVLSSIAGCLFIPHSLAIGIMLLAITILSFLFSTKYYYKKRNVVLTVIFILFFAVFTIPLASNYQTVDVNSVLQNEMTSAEKGSSSQKLPPYLQGVDDIEDADELRKFYYKIASDFYNNEMGLKGSPEQIDAGNKVMSDVYGFLGLSLSKGEIQNVDSIKAVIQNNAVISDYRKKKAIEELELGIETIESFQ